MKATTWTKGSHGPSWPDWRVELLRKLWDDGVSAAKIGVALGFDAKGKGRCAVAGKARRLGLPRRVHVAANKNNPGNAVLGVGAVFNPAIWKFDFAHLNDGAVAALDLKASGCKFPTGDPREPGFHFCGRTRRVGQFCEHHAGIVYDQAYRNRRKTAHGKAAA